MDKKRKQAEDTTTKRKRRQRGEDAESNKSKKKKRNKKAKVVARQHTRACLRLCRDVGAGLRSQRKNGPMKSKTIKLY
jgi:hypothetical protein